MTQIKKLKLTADWQSCQTQEYYHRNHGGITHGEGSVSEGTNGRSFVQTTIRPIWGGIIQPPLKEGEKLFPQKGTMYHRKMVHHREDGTTDTLWEGVVEWE